MIECQKNNRGWILVDAMFGIVIISFVVLALMASYIQTTKSTSYSDKATQATYIAQRGLESLKKYDGGITAPVLPATTTSGIFTITYQQDAITKQLSHIAALNIAPVRIIVTWPEPNTQKTNTIQVSSYYFYYDNP